MSKRVRLNTTAPLQKDSPLPLYYQLKELIREQIEKDNWSAGQQLPSEPKLCETFQVSRTVVRHALQDLEHEGFLYREQGKGTFVAEPKISESLMQDLSGFYEDMVAKGHTPVTEVLNQEVRPAHRTIADYLQIDPDDDVIVIERLRSISAEPNQPVVLVTTHLPYDICPGLADEDFTTQSLYALLEQKYNLKLSHGRRTIEAKAANQYEAELLNVQQGAPLIVLDSVSYLEDGRPIEYFHALHRGDRSKFEVELYRKRERRSQ